MLVLPMHRHQAPAELPQLAWRRGPSVKLGARTLAQVALKLESRATPRLERRLDRGTLGPMAHLVGTAPSAQCKSQRVDYQGLAAAGLAGEEVEAGLEANR